jgi:hypothetical protein
LKHSRREDKRRFFEVLLARVIAGLWTFDE